MRGLGVSASWLCSWLHIVKLLLACRNHLLPSRWVDVNHLLWHHHHGLLLCHRHVDLLCLRHHDTWLWLCHYHAWLLLRHQHAWLSLSHHHRWLFLLWLSLQIKLDLKGKEIRYMYLFCFPRFLLPWGRLWHRLLNWFRRWLYWCQSRGIYH